MPRAERKVHLESEIRRVWALHRKRSELWNARRETVLVELPEPVFAGWERYWFVRPDLAHSSEGPALARLLAVLQKVDISHRKDFAERDWLRGGKKRPTEHKLHVVSEEDFFEKVGADLRDQFTLVFYKDQWERKQAAFVYRYPWKFVSRVRPYYFTHRALPHSAVESELSEIDKAMFGRGWIYRHSIRHHGAWNDWNYSKADTGPMVLSDEVSDLPLRFHGQCAANDR